MTIKKEMSVIELMNHQLTFYKSVYPIDKD